MKKRLVSRRSVLRSAVGASVAVATVGVSGRAAFGATKPVVLKLGHPDTTQHPDQKVAEKFADLVAQKTNGSVKVQVYAGGQLGSEVNLVSGLQTGIIDLCIQTTGFLEQFFPPIQVLDLPFLFPNRKAAENVIDGPIGKQIFGLMPAKGIYGLTWGWFGWREVETTDHAVHEPSDLRGLKIRIQPGAVFAASFKAVGAVPTALDLSEVYLGLSQGTINAVELPLVAMVADSKLYEVTKYIAMTNHDYNTGALMASKIKFDALTKAQQEAIREAAHEIQPIWRQTIAESSDKAIQFIKSQGLKVDKTDYAAFRKATAPVYSKFKDRIGANLYNRVLHSVDG